MNRLKINDSGEVLCGRDMNICHFSIAELSAPGASQRPRTEHCLITKKLRDHPVVIPREHYTDEMAEVKEAIDCFANEQTTDLRRISPFCQVCRSFSLRR